MPVSDKEYEKTIEIRKKILDNELAFTDCLILAQAKEYRLTAYSSNIKMQNNKEVEVINPFV